MPPKSDIQIFLAHASEDKAEVLTLYDSLKASGYKPWLDVKDLLPGQQWRVEIPRALKKSNIVIACLSQTSIAKQGYIQREFKLALNESIERSSETIYLIPLKLTDCQVPDVQIAQYEVSLRDFQWVDYWRPDGFARLTQAIERLRASLDPVAAMELPEPSEATAASYYVERPPIESLCYQEVLKPGAIIRIRAPRQMGTTFLIDRIFDYAAHLHYRTAPLNLLQANEATLASLDEFLRWFCKQVGRRLKLESRLADYWDADSGCNDNCTAYFEDYLLDSLDTPLVLGLENLDRIFSYKAVAASFLGLLRAWHEDAKYMETWQKLRLVLAVSTEVYIQLDINQSPFNVGLPIELPEFNAEQVRQLAQQYGLAWSPNQFEQLMAMIGGHPYLVDRALTYVKASDDALDAILIQAPTEAGIYQSHLRELWRGIHPEPQLTATLKSIVMATEPISVDRDLAFKLDSMGLVKKQGNLVEPRCQLYRLYFQDCLQSRGAT